MNLSQAITKAKSIPDYNDIFGKEVHVQLGWMDDNVKVIGYEGVVTTDFIAHSLMNVSAPETEDSRRLAALLAEKVFIPLKNLVEAPENQCSLYQLAALTRICWTPPQAPEFGHSVALKHAMVLGLLDSKFLTA